MSFAVKFLNKQIPISIPPHISLSQSDLFQFRPFTNWLATLEKSVSQSTSQQFSLNGIEIQSIDKFSKGKIGFIKLKADLIHPNGKPLPGIVLLRGGTVGILVALTPEEAEVDDTYIVLVSQTRVPAGIIDLTELPAGMIDDGTFTGSAAKELEEECGIKIQESQLIDLLNHLQTDQTNSILLSPGITDEDMRIFLHQKKMPLSEIISLQGRLSGNHDNDSSENEVITVKLLKLDEAETTTRDAKLLIAISLYRRYLRSIWI